MGRIKPVISLSIFILTFILSASSVFAERTAEFEKMNDMYRKVYPYMTYKDTVYTFESEFVFPDGYHRPDSVSTPDFSNWVARMPIWYSYKSIGDWRGVKIMKYEEVSRAVHIPWKGTIYRDYAFPIRILAEYFVYKNDFDRFDFLPPKGEVLTYQKWLSGKPKKRAGGEYFIEPDMNRESSLKEFYGFMSYIMEISNYGTLIKNCDKISEADILPGDIYISTDSTGRKGKAYFIINKLVSDKDEPLFIIATSGKDACDFHIPLIGEDRNNPWITKEKIKEYVGENEINGYYRLKDIEQ